MRGVPATCAAGRDSRAGWVLVPSMWRRGRTPINAAGTVRRPSTGVWLLRNVRRLAGAFLAERRHAASLALGLPLSPRALDTMVAALVRTVEADGHFDVGRVLP